MPIMFSRRVSASRGRLAWMVPSEPSWPVFMACSMSMRLGAADLAEDDAVGAHTQRVLHEVAHVDFADALEVGRARLQADHVRLLELQFGGVLDGDDALADVDQLGHRVQAASSCPSRYRRR